MAGGSSVAKGAGSPAKDLNFFSMTPETTTAAVPSRIRPQSQPPRVRRAGNRVKQAGDHLAEKDIAVRRKAQLRQVLAGFALPGNLADGDSRSGLRHGERQHDRRPGCEGSLVSNY